MSWNILVYDAYEINDDYKWLDLIYFGETVWFIMIKPPLSISDLLHCTEEPNVSIPTLANLLIERAQSPNWIVVFKSLVTIHHLMCYGNEVRTDLWAIDKWLLNYFKSIHSLIILSFIAYNVIDLNILSYFSVLYSI